MDTKEMGSTHELRADGALMNWATASLPSSLAVSVQDALKAIAATGVCNDGLAEWVLFGEVVQVRCGPPKSVHVRRTSMLLNDDLMANDGWKQFEVCCQADHARVDFTPGMFLGLLTKPSHRPVVGTVIADEQAVIWNISMLDLNLAWNVSHLFSGAYEGWLRSMSWLQQANVGQAFASHTSIDWCPAVMKTWAYNHNKEFWCCPIKVNYNPPDVYNGILANISDPSILRASSNRSNLVLTLSPPCPSWSKGGKNSGLATEEGFFFLDAILHVARCRPVLALFECSDGIEAHPHWRALSAGLQLAGYVKIWSQDVAIHQLTGNHRTRWLAVWARTDVKCQRSYEKIMCNIPRRLAWDDARHLFALPKALSADLTLQSELIEIYGDKKLLPPAKRARVGEVATAAQVLSARLLQQGEYLPTLCASYTAQHLLQREHVEEKGIFATLLHKGDEFRFIDPFAFVSLFGTSDCIGLPTDIRRAFHQLGNAISQLHALVAFLFALEGVSDEQMSKLTLLRQCWEDRLTSQNAIVRTCGDMYVLQPIADFATKAIPSIGTWQPWLVGHTLIRFCDDAALIPINMQDDINIIDQLLMALQLESHHAELLVRDGRDLPSSIGWNELSDGDFGLRLGTADLGTLRVFCMNRDGMLEDPIVSPTQPWNIDEADPELDHLVDAHCNGFLHVLEHLCQDDSPLHVGKVLFLLQDGSSEWISKANLDRIGSIPTFRHQGDSVHFFQVNREACRVMLGTQVIIAIRGEYEPLSNDKWILLAGGSDLKWCKISKVPRGVTPTQCTIELQQNCQIIKRNLVHCRQEQPLMLINGDLLWCDARVQNASSIVFGGMDRLIDHPSCNILGDRVTERMLQFNLEPGALAIDEIVFHFDFLQMLMPSVCWCPPAIWISNEAQFRFPPEPADLLLCFQHFVVPILVLFDWIFVEVRFFEGQWRVLYHSPEQLTHRQRQAVLELIHFMGVQVLPKAFRWIRTAEDSDLAPWYTLRSFYARAGAPLLPQTHRTTQRLQRVQNNHHVMQVIDQADLVWRDSQVDDRMLQFARASRNAFLVAILEAPSRAEDLGVRATGRPPYRYSVNEIFFVADEWLDMRLNIYRTHPGWASNDEIEFAMAFFLPESFCPPVLHHDLSIIAASVKPLYEDVQRFVALREGHWIGIEVICNAREHTCRVVFLQVPPRDQRFWASFAEDFIVPVGFRPIIIVDTSRTWPGMCGWELLHRWIVVDVSLPDTFHIPQQKRQLIDQILEESNQAWRATRAPPMLRTYAENMRRLFLVVGGQQLLHPCSALSLGGMEGTASPDTAMATPDPWQFDDPWTTKQKTLRQSKWEDLQLQSDHPFVDKNKTPVPFVQKQQLSTNKGGIAFVSKGNLQQAKEVVPKEPCALLLPMIDPMDALGKLANLTGPFEVIVFDPAMNQEYKRQVHLLVITPEVTFKLPTPSITLTLAAVSEIVLECDARLTSKDTFNAFYDNPLAKFKIHLKEVCSDPIWGHAAIYGYRVIQEHSKEKHDVVHQCLLKVQQTHRTPLLAASGTGELIVRDFVPKGAQVPDLSIIPRFWPVDRTSKADLIKAAASITGYRGIAVTKRGLAPRFATDALATARDLLLPQDDRICAINKAMIPKINMDSLGWPYEILAKDIVSAVYQATKTPCIPTRSFRRAGVCAWTLSFEKPPTVSKFSVQVNEKTFEVLLTPIAYKPPSKGKGKMSKSPQVGGQEISQPRTVVSKDIHHERIDRLEEQVGRLEQKHEHLSEKVDNQFTQVGDQLRQILQCVQPRQREHGETPPPVKHHRAA